MIVLAVIKSPKTAVKMPKTRFPNVIDNAGDKIKKRTVMIPISEHSNLNASKDLFIVTPLSIIYEKSINRLMMLIVIHEGHYCN